MFLLHVVSRNIPQQKLTTSCVTGQYACNIYVCHTINVYTLSKSKTSYAKWDFSTRPDVTLSHIS